MRRKAILLLSVMGAALVISSGIALAVTRQCKTIDPNTGAGTCYGTKERDKLFGTDGFNIMYGKGSGDTLDGFGSGDILYGQKGNDKLIGGFGNDLLYPGPGNDTSDGSLGEDHYFIEANNWGKDTISISEFAASEDRGDHLEFGDIGTQLTINLVSNPNQDEVRNADGTSTINWSLSAINILRDDNSGNDTINGNPAANVIFLGFGKGSDSVFAGGGNDYVDVRDNEPNDTVDCGGIIFPDDDEVHYDSPTRTPPGDTVINCERLHPS